MLPSQFRDAAHTICPGMLGRLGFTSDEIIQCWEDKGRLIAPATVAGELMRSSAVGFGPAEAGFVIVPDYQVLGVEDHFARAVVSGSDRLVGSSVDGRPVAGAIGKMRFRGRTVAFDFVHSSIAATAPFSPPWAERSVQAAPAY